LTTGPPSSLLREARQGSDQAMNELMREVAPRLLGFIRLCLGSDLRRRVESQDVLQSTLLKAFQRMEQFEGSGTRSLYAWMAAIARNEIRDQRDFHGRRRRDAAMVLSLGSGLEQLEAKVRSEVSRIQLRERELQLEHALEELKPAQREIIVLRKFEELSFAEIGERLGKSPDACRMLFARAMAALTRSMEETP
jgi:RNA polymerase sigma-70 factor (ECF subfamily)